MFTTIILLSLSIGLLSIIGLCWNCDSGKFDNWFNWLTSIFAVLCIISFGWALDQFQSRGRYFEEKLLNTQKVFFSEPMTHSFPLIKKTIVIEDGADIDYWIIPDYKK